MFEYQTQNEWIVNFRQLLLIEKFRNPKMTVLYKKLYHFVEYDYQKLKKHFQRHIEYFLTIIFAPYRNRAFYICMTGMLVAFRVVCIRYTTVNGHVNVQCDHNVFT